MALSVLWFPQKSYFLGPFSFYIFFLTLVLAVAFVGCTVVSFYLKSFYLVFLGEAGFDSPAKMAGWPRMGVHPLPGGFSYCLFICL